MLQDQNFSEKKAVGELYVSEKWIFDRSHVIILSFIGFIHLPTKLQNLGTVELGGMDFLECMNAVCESSHHITFLCFEIIFRNYRIRGLY